MSIEIKVVEQDDISELKRLFERTPILTHYNPFSNGSVDEFRWQFFNDGYQSSIYIMAYDSVKDELAGTLSALFIPMKSPDGQVYQTLKIEDALINKALVQYRDRDILKELLDAIELKAVSLNVKFLWAFTYAVSSFERLHFTNCFSSKQGTYIIKPLAAYRHLISLNASNGTKQKIQIGGLTTISYLKRLLTHKRHGELTCKEIIWNDIDEEILLSFLPDNLYSIYLDRHFLNWRITENPSSLSYSVLQIKNQDGRIKAYFIYSQKEGKVFFVEQFLFDRNLSMELKAKIIQLVLIHLKSLGAVIVRTMGFDHDKVNKDEITLLTNAGSVFINRGIPFVFKSLDGNIKPDEIYLSRLNTEGTF
jgi:hypothetical protein